jgi:MFS family permease
VVVRNVGHIRAFSVMAAIGTITILINLLWINDVGWIVMRALSGFCFAGAAMIVESWLNEVADNKSRGTIFSIYVTINLAASTMGQMAMSITGTAGYLPFIIGAISFICAVLPTALTSTPQPRPLASAKLDLPLLIRTSPVAAVAAFCCGMANGSFGTLAPVYGYEQGLDSAGIALLFAIAAIAGAVAQIPFGRLSDRIDRRLVMIGLAGASAVTGVLVIILNPEAGWVMYILFALYGLFANPLYPIAVAHANDFARDGGFAKVAGGMLLILGCGLAVGPAVSSVLMSTISPTSLFVVTAIFHAVVAGFAFLRMRVRKSIDAADRAPFQPMGTDKQVTPESIVLDPRADGDSPEMRVDEPPVPEELATVPNDIPPPPPQDAHVQDRPL